LVVYFLSEQLILWFVCSSIELTLYFIDNWLFISVVLVWGLGVIVVVQFSSRSISLVIQYLQPVVWV